MSLQNASQAELSDLRDTLQTQLQQLKQRELNLDITRGKPAAAQLDLADAIDGIIKGDYKHDGTDLRNYGGLDGLPAAKALFSQMLQVSPEQTLIGGNSSLTLMYQSVQFAWNFGTHDGATPWSKEANVKFLCPVPGYDRHFAICERFGIEMIQVAMLDDGPDMDFIEAQLKADPAIKGIWCVPRFSNPTGHTYSDETVRRFAGLGKIASDNFRIFWDNAYSVHSLQDDATELLPLLAECEKQGTEDSALIFGSTSKITDAGAGVAFMGASAKNLAQFKAQLGIASIGPDKINQWRHVEFLKDMDGIKAHMQKHAAILQPKFDLVLKTLNEALGDSGDYGSWTTPEGGYFISLDTQPGLARQVVAMAADAGVKLTAAGATFPLRNDPQDRNIRIAPSFPPLDELATAVEVLTVCVKLATVEQLLA